MFLRLLCCLTFSCSTLLRAENAYTNPTEAAEKDQDFSVQGEYTGELGGKKVGVQLVAEGAGKFVVVWYPGGLPGDGFGGDKSSRIKGSVSDGKISLSGHEGTVEAGEITFKEGSLNKIERKSPTLGAAAPAGAIVLFDGKSTDAFEKGQLDGDTLMPGVTTKEKWMSFTLHVEFKIPYMPAARGQGRGNSGCYLQGRYEVQMLDSFGLEGANNECGGIYTIAQPKVNMAFPPLAWQTYDIDYTAPTYDAAGKKTANAKTTVKQNGVVIHDQVELTHATTSAPLPESPEPGPLHLQNHGNPVRYRNLWIVKK
jgi:hypothetical protein